mmetsp:Transcript_31603/g.63267  ORF Transcript_31603/g.63267 Transcript_31603/m.63267 type:complete len:621 (+) Transcript_31603:94-1956(+)
MEVANLFLTTVLLGETKTSSGSITKNINITNVEGTKREILSLGNQYSNVVAEWIDGDTVISSGKNDDDSDEWRNWIVLAVYPEVALRKIQGVGALLTSMLRRYSMYYEHYCNTLIEGGGDSIWNLQLAIPPQEEFDSAFNSILRRFQEQLSTTNTSSTSISSLEKRQNKNSSNKQSTKQSSSGTKKGKEKTVWYDGKGKVTKAALEELDMSKDKSTDILPGGSEIREDARAVAEARAAYLPTEGERPAWEEEDDIVDDIDIQWNDSRDNNSTGETDDQPKTGIKGFFASFLATNRPLTKGDLQPPLQQMQQLLTSKNVAPSTAKAICEVVEKQLLGKKVGSLMGVKRAVRHALEDAIERILRPEIGGIAGRGTALGVRGGKSGKSVDVLRGVVEKRERGKSGGLMGIGGNSSNRARPFVIVMIGINGVGKSTSLAKIAYYLQSNNCYPLLAACDTFRSGAVEQLSVHASCLSLPLYHQGYAKDPSSVAKAAINKATDDGNDVVLIDTAGRMQNNVPLMKALAKLVTETSPDLVLFVCEALVGNDGMDQLTMFQKALTSGGHSRPIDGIVLTKFDTVSDKVGAALTLTHLTGVPIAFCGTGQKYNHLKPLSVPFVIQSLFS